MTAALLRWALRRSAAASYMSICAFASPPGQQWKVAILGAAGGIGQTPSLLMKLNPMVSHLSHYDIAGTPGVAADVSYVNTRSEDGIRSLIFPLYARLKMSKRGRPRSQASQDADNHLRVDKDSVVDDIIPVALAKRFRERLAEIGPGTSGSQERCLPGIMHY
ncbi:hypothetical protein SASPL_114794 [Salvia splendens]|uniref:malate dehydrogenase n=1 Tax=Salvia splendens TaxID=180675 RepID=A0A8X9A1I7_SALSN|nr:hypothetical protein SASPL_114794 [Salvia splendens]